jgi:hypothetical protein
MIPRSWHRQQRADVPDLVESAIGALGFDQNAVAVPVGIVGVAFPGVGRDKLIDEFFDGGIGGVCG